MVSIRMLFIQPRSNFATKTVRNVPTIKARKMTMYMLTGATWWPWSDVPGVPLAPAAALVCAIVVADQVKQREQEDPDNVDEVPVEAGDFDRRVVLGVEMPPPRHGGDDQHDPDANDHVHGVQPRHHEVQRIELFRGRRVLSRPLEVRARNQVVLELVR